MIICLMSKYRQFFSSCQFMFAGGDSDNGGGGGSGNSSYHGGGKGGGSGSWGRVAAVRRG